MSDLKNLAFRVHDLSPPNAVNFMSSPGPSTSTQTPISADQKGSTNQDVADDIAAVSERRGGSREKEHVAARDLAEKSKETNLDILSLSNSGQEKAINRPRSIKENSDEDIAKLQEKTQSLSVSQDLPSTSRVVPIRPDGREHDAHGMKVLEESKDEIYQDPTPETPRQENSPSRGPQVREEVKDDGSTSEIQDIMDQFDGGANAIEHDEDKSSAVDTGHYYLGAPVEHPPRRSSLEPLRPLSSTAATKPSKRNEIEPYDLKYEESSHKPGTSHATDGSASRRTSSILQSSRLPNLDPITPASPSSSKSLSKLPPPEPDPEPDLPFDFHRFLEQLRHRTADPVAKFLRSFLIEFGKKQWMVHEQVKIINDFLSFITIKMAQCEVWRGVSDAEFDNAKEGMEKLVMNRLYSQTFSPAIPAPAPTQTIKGKKKTAEKSVGPGRRGQHQEDIERDEILGQKVRIYGWVREEHLDIPQVSDSGRRFLVLAQQGINA